MKDKMEELFQRADFSKESNVKNRLYYELFHKPVPVEEHKGLLLTDDELFAAAGGITRQMPGTEDTVLEEIRPEENIVILRNGNSVIRADLAELRSLGVNALRAGETVDSSVLRILRNVQ